MDKRCITNLNGQLRLTVGKTYEIIDTVVMGMSIISNDDGEVMGYPSRYFVPVDKVVRGITVPLVGPIYEIGEVLDLRYITDGLPNRIKVLEVEYYNKQYRYTVLLESTGSKVVMYEDWLIRRVKEKTAPVYKSDTIISRYSSGLRWVGNYNENLANTKRKAIIDSGIANAFVREAYDRDGNLVGGKCSVWIKYNNENIINDDGHIGARPKSKAKQREMCTRDIPKCMMCIYGNNGHRRSDYCVNR